MFAISDEELGEHIEKVDCPHCGNGHDIEYGTTRTLQPDNTWSEPVKDNTLGFYKCGGKSYLASIKGRAIDTQRGEE